MFFRDILTHSSLCLCDFQQLGYSYIWDEAEERILACVAKWKFYARILNNFFVSTNKTNIATNFL